MSIRDGVLVIEDPGLTLREDRVFDPPMDSIGLVPSGDGYAVSLIPSANEPVTGQAVRAGQAG